MSKRILIVRLSAIGDVVHGTPVARQLKQQFPDCHLTWIVQQKALASIANNPWVDHIEVLPYYGTRPLWRVWPKLRKHFDITIDLQGLARSGVITLQSKSPMRLGRQDAREFARLAYTHQTPACGQYQYVSQRYLEQCLDLGVDINDYVPELHPSPEDHAAAEHIFAVLPVASGRPVVALIAFAAGRTRLWPPERFAELGDRLAEEHGAICVIPGARSEAPAAEALAARMRHRPIILAGQTSLGQAAAVLQRCDLAIGAETGLTHFSFAVGTPLICLLGPSPIHNGPTGEKAITLYSPCETRPCRPYESCPRGPGRPCMTDITVDQVMATAGKLLTA